jgi:hypothetical protein
LVNSAPATSGTLFPVGRSTVVFRFQDASGNVGFASATVTVVDATPPLLTVPSRITAFATSDTGAVVTFAVTATDIVDLAPTVNCIPPSGSRFPIGTSEVRCTATDASGNTSAASFWVDVLGAPEQIVALLEFIRRTPFENSAKTTLIAFLQEALTSPRNTTRVCRALNNLIRFVQALPSTLIDANTQAHIVEEATQICAVLGCN